MPSILSTKVLSSSQREHVLNAHLELVEYNAIHTIAIDFNIDLDSHNNFIFTSQTAVEAIVRKGLVTQLKNKNLFCVGTKTRALIESLGLTVVVMESNAQNLAQHIIKKYAKQSFLFFCGNRRRDELSQLLAQQKIDLVEVIVYNTQLNSKKIERTFDGIFFFSPSAVESYYKTNSASTSTLFCIGSTTAEMAAEHSNTIVIAQHPTIENVIIRAIKHFKSA